MPVPERTARWTTPAVRHRMCRDKGLRSSIPQQGCFVLPSSRHPSPNPVVQAAARLPAYIVLALLAVAVTAGGLVAARGETPPAEPDDLVVGDVTETALPTPVPLESATPLPTPVPMGQAATADTAVAFWEAWVPDEVAEEFSEAMVAAYGPRATRPVLPAQPGPTPEPVAPAPESDSDSAATTTPAPAPIATLVPIPVPTTLVTPAPLVTTAPLPVPLPSAPLPVATPALPPLLP